ncbi:MAG: type III secretion system inner membrane ring lipoprotein SctJ [Burkholderiaceae bacterium]
MNSTSTTHDFQRPPHTWLAAVRILVLCAVGMLAACTETVNLQTGLKDADANEIISLLSRNGIEAKKHQTKEGVTLTVKDADISRATEAMRTAGLPRRGSTDLGQIFKKEGMISTPLEERVRYIHGLSAELENTLQQFDNVVTARVHVVLPERIAPGEPIQPSSAAVFIKYHLPFDQDTAIPQIRRLVATSIPGLSDEDARSKVSVVLTQTDIATPSVEWTNLGPFIVQTASAGMLAATLIGFGLVTLFSLGGVVCLIVMGNPAARDWIKQRAGKVSGIRSLEDNKNSVSGVRQENNVS